MTPTPGRPPGHPLPRLLRHARRFRRSIVLASLCSITNKLLDLAPPALIGAAVDIVVQRSDSLIARLGFPDVEDQLWVLAALTLVIWTLESVSEYAARVIWRNLAQDLQHELRIDAYRNVQRLELSYFEDRSTGGLMSILSDDVNQLERFLDGGAHDLLQLAVTALAIGTAFFVISPEVAWLAMLPVPVVIWGSLRFQRRIAPWYADVRERVGLLNGQLANNISGIATIKSFCAEGYETRRIAGESEAYRTSNSRAIRLSSAFSPLIRMVIVVGFGVTLVYGGFLALEGRLNVGAYSVLVFLTQRLLWPFTSLGIVLDLYQRAMASTQRILDLLGTRPRVGDGTRGLDVDAVRGVGGGAVAFDSVNFAYEPGHAVLRDLTLSFPAGETTAVVGSTGAGKSTIVKLLLRFYEWPLPAEDGPPGCITLDGIDIHDLRLEDLRRSVALVSQDVFLFHGTVRDNIAYGHRGRHDDPEGTPFEAVVEAAQAAEAHEFIMRLPDGYDTIVGERGQKLSGGQRQRIALSRAILKDAPILILDEATSSVDNETEAAIQRSLARVSVGRTTIVIAHRLSTVRQARRIHVIESGSVAESGTHEELLGRDGIYAGLWRVQTGGAVVGAG